MGGSSNAGMEDRIGAQQRANASYMTGMAQGQYGGQGLMRISKGKLTPFEEQMYQQQLQAVELGQQGAGQQIEQTVREGATARGLFSSRGAISEEANQLANLPLQKALQLSGVYSNQANLSRSGILQGMALRGNLMSGATSAYGQAAQTYATGDQLQQQANQGTMQGVLGAGRLVAGVMTGGASEVAYQAANAAGGGYQNFSKPQMGLNGQSLSNYDPYSQQLGTGGRYF
jgi:hypothetical protein